MEAGVRGAAGERERKESNNFVECFKILSLFSHMHLFF